MTNSSISLPAWRVTPRTIALVASSGVTPLAAYASGLRNAAIKPSCCSGLVPLGSETTLKSTSYRSTVSVSIECPNRYTVWANSATIEASRSTS
ncbi:hypothetical protein D3C76_1602170 [compost metagenome]